MSQNKQKCYKRSTAEVGEFVDALCANVQSEKHDGTFDSAAAGDFISTAINQNSVKVPEPLQAVLDEAKGEESKIARAIFDSCSEYEKANGCPAPADLVEQAIHNAYSTTLAAARKDTILDSATNLHHDQLSLQPNRAVVAIISTMADACPFAHYLPADIGSNEAKLAILTHVAGDKFGGYAANQLIDGVSSGESYMLSSRVNTSMPSDGTSGGDSAGRITGKITAVQLTPDTCDSSAGDLKLLRGRTIVYIEGRIAATEAPNGSGTGASPISGTITISGTSYAISGTINTDTGVYTLDTTPALPNTVPVTVEGFIDFEREDGLTPSIITNVQTYALFANPSRVISRLTPDARTQISNELGLDPLNESVIAINAQYNNERYYNALRKGMRLATMNQEDFDYSKAIQHQDSSRQLAWQDFAYQLNVLSQRMAEETIDHGVTHLYVGNRVAAQLSGLPSTLFQSSGLRERPGIYRLGRLFGRFEVYYTPKVVTETETTSQILCVGRATDVARNPIVFGDAVSPTVIPLAVNADLRQGVGFYARNFTSVNPHDLSARGFGLINVKNM